MPFGLCYAPATFEHLMESVSAGLHWDVFLIYLNDIIRTGKTFEEMLLNFKKLVDRLNGAGPKLKAKKCCLFAKKVTYLGHVVSAEGVATDPSKTAVVEHWPVLRMPLKYDIFSGYALTLGNLLRIPQTLLNVCVP